MPKQLREAINDVVVQCVTSKLQRGEPVDVAFMAREITGSLIDMVLEQEEKHQGPLLTQIMGYSSGQYPNGAGSFSRNGAITNGNEMGPPSATISRFRGHPRISKIGPKAWARAKPGRVE